MADNGLASLQRRLAAIPRQMKREVQPALLKGAEDMAADMKRLAPEDDGWLKDSIVVTPAGERTPAHSQPGGSKVVPENAVAVTAGDTLVRYAHLIEFGTAPHINAGQFPGTKHPGSAAQPFFWPGYRLNRKKVKSRISRAISKAVKGKK
jgi:HK97 gp10 family phage protein